MVKSVSILNGGGSSDMTVAEERWSSTMNHLASCRSSIPPLSPSLRGHDGYGLDRSMFEVVGVQIV